MGYQSSRTGYAIRVDGLLLGGDRFVIQAAVEYDPELTGAQREALVPRAQLELLLAIEGEEDRARRSGVRTVHVGVVGDEALYRAFRARTREPLGRAGRARARVPAPRETVGPRRYANAQIFPASRRYTSARSASPPES